MQPERQISVACAAIGAALIIPEILNLSRHPGVQPGASMVVGAVLGALGATGGCLVASGHPARLARALGFTLWGLLGLAFSRAVLAGALHGVGWGRRVVLVLAGLLPIAGPITVVARRDGA